MISRNTIIFIAFFSFLAFGLYFFLTANRNSWERNETDRLKDIGRENLLRNALETYSEKVSGKLPVSNRKLVDALFQFKIEGQYFLQRSDFLFNEKGELVNRFGHPLRFKLEGEKVILIDNTIN